MNEKWQQVFEDKKLTEELFEQKNVEDIQSLLKSKGFDFSVNEINEVGKEIRETMSKVNSGELSAEDLEAAAGGGAGSYVGGFVFGFSSFVAATSVFW